MRKNFCWPVILAEGTRTRFAGQEIETILVLCHWAVAEFGKTWMMLRRTMERFAKKADNEEIKVIIVEKKTDPEALHDAMVYLEDMNRSRTDCESDLENFKEANDKLVSAVGNGLRLAELEKNQRLEEQGRETRGGFISGILEAIRSLFRGGDKGSKTSKAMEDMSMTISKLETCSIKLKETMNTAMITVPKIQGDIDNELKLNSRSERDAGAGLEALQKWQQQTAVSGTTQLQLGYQTGSFGDIHAKDDCAPPYSA